MSTVPPYRNGELAAEALRNELGYGAMPIDNLWRTIRHDLDLDLAFSGFTQDGGDGLYHWDGRRGLIVINKANRPARQRFTAAHELGHHVMHRPEDQGPLVIADRDVYETQGEDQEVEANSFAACFLAPKAALAAEVTDRVPEDYKVDDVVPLMATYGLSCSSLIYRLKNIGFLRQADVARLKEESIGQVTALLELYGYSEDDILPHGSDLPEDYVRTVLELFRGGSIDDERVATLLRTSRAKARELVRALPVEDSAPASDVMKLLAEVDAEDDGEEEPAEAELAEAT